MLSFASTHWYYLLCIACANISVFWVSPSNAQITPDSTLPNNSTVNLQGNTTLIEAGTTAGNNLFHSFKEFSVPTRSQAYFNNSVDINNILTRVTGGSISNIDGLIRANGTANLFLINPSGIVFGENARLDIGGSFVGTTADAIAFDEENFFSASDPQNSSSLLGINPNALFFNQIKPASIENNSTVDVGLENTTVSFLSPSQILGEPPLPVFYSFAARGLRVPDGKSLLLVGGDVTMNSGSLVALGGRVELGGLASRGTVGLNVDGNNFSLSFPSGVTRSDVKLINDAGVRVAAGNGGNIAVNARNFEMTGKSFLFAGIESRLSSEQSRSGNIDVNVTGVIDLKNESSIRNLVLPEAKGQGGDTNLSARTLLVKDLAQVNVNTFGTGNAGNLTIDAEDIQLINKSQEGQFPTRLSASTEANATGDAGNLKIETNSLLVKDGAQVGVDTFGNGNGGKLTVDAEDIQLIGTNKDGRFPSGLFNSSQKPNSTGNGGDLTIKTKTFLAKDGAQVFIGTFSGGKSGELTIEAKDVQLIGTSKDGRFSSGLFASAEPNSTGDAGNLTIKTNTLLLEGGAVVGADTFGAGKGGELTVDAQDVQLIGTRKDGRFSSGLFASTNSTGDAGNLTIKTNTLLLEGGAVVDASTFGAGKGGELTVDAQDVQLIGTTKDGLFPSGLFASANSTGDAGNLTIKTNTLRLEGGAVVGADTFGAGKGGELTIEAQDVIGTSKDGLFPSGLFASANSTGDAGNLTIKTNTLRLEGGAQVGAGTFGAGKGGELTVDAQDVQLIGTTKDGRFPSGFFASAQANSTGDGGDLNINASTLQVGNGAKVSVASFSEEGTAGNLTINADSIRLNNDALLTADTRSNKVDPEREQATININSQDLIMRRGSNIFTNAEGENVQGGNINIDADIIAAFENSDISANSKNFRGGNVLINTQGLFGIQFRPQPTNFSDITATGASDDLSGNVEIINPDIDPNTGLVNLPSIPVETEVAQTCATGSSIAQSRFEIIGRGGLPHLPTDALSADAVQVDLVSIKPEVNKPAATNVSTKPNTSTPKKIVEATGWVRNDKGEIFFVADAANGKQIDNWYKNNHCRG